MLLPFVMMCLEDLKRGGQINRVRSKPFETFHPNLCDCHLRGYHGWRRRETLLERDRGDLGNFLLLARLGGERFTSTVFALPGRWSDSLLLDLNE